MPEEKNAMLQEKALQTSFIIMPGNALKSLRDELLISIGDKISGGILYRYGYRCGEGMMQKMGMTCSKLEEVADMLPGLWAGVGLGRVSIMEVKPDDIVIKLEESLESFVAGQSGQPSCDFTRGYLAGMVYSLYGKSVSVNETACVSRGDQFCVLNLAVSKEVMDARTEESVGTKAKYQLETGMSYLLEADDADWAYEVFLDCVTHGHIGLCITRDFPEKVRKKWNLKNTPILWLSNAEKEYAVEPVQLGKLYHKIEDFLKKSEKPVVMLSGIEYLITQNSYSSALKFIQLVKDQIAIYDAILLTPVVPMTLPDKDLKMLERELEVIVPPAPNP